jgi:ATP-dependent Zn protease
MKKNEVMNLNKIKDRLLKEIIQEKMEFQKEIIKRKMVKIEELKMELKNKESELEKILRGEIDYDSLYKSHKKAIEFRERGFINISGEL